MQFLKIAMSQYDQFVSDWLKDQLTPLSDIIHKNKVVLFQKTSPKKQSRTTYKINLWGTAVNCLEDCIYDAKSRNGDKDDFFRHENQWTPPVLSDMEELRQCSKSDLIRCLIQQGAASVQEPPQVDAKNWMGLSLWTCWFQSFVQLLVTMWKRSSCHTYSGIWSMFDVLILSGIGMLMVPWRILQVTREELENLLLSRDPL